MSIRPIRIATRAVILHENRLLMVNAYKNDTVILWCAPGGGADAGHSLPENLAREVYEECGLDIAVGAPCLINEFHNPNDGFHQVEVFFRCTILRGTLTNTWRDPEYIVTQRRFFTRAEMGGISFKPDKLVDVAWGDCATIPYDALEELVPRA